MNKLQIVVIPNEAEEGTIQPLMFGNSRDSRDAPLNAKTVWLRIAQPGCSILVDTNKLSMLSFHRYPKDHTASFITARSSCGGMSLSSPQS